MSSDDRSEATVATVIDAVRTILSSKHIRYYPIYNNDLSTRNFRVLSDSNSICYILFNDDCLVLRKRFLYYDISYRSDGITVYYGDPDLFDNVLKNIQTIFDIDNKTSRSYVK